MKFRVSCRRLVAWSVLAVAVLVAGCTTQGLAPLQGLQRPVDLARFMGDWYVVGFIPIDLPFMSEADAHNGVESYRLTADGSIATTYTFRDGGFDGPQRRMTPRATVANPPLNSEWKMKFKWFLPAGDFLIIYLDDAYQRTIVAVPDRRWIWLMSRSPDVTDGEYAALLDVARQAGYEAAAIRKVPQRWP